MAIDLNEMILRFFKNDIGRILIMDGNGEILYEDAKAASVRQGKTNWKEACPPPAYGQRAEMWELVDSGSGKTYLVYSSTFREDGRLRQIHHLMDTSLYTELVRDMSEYSKKLQYERDHDGLTGLYNKGKFISMKQSVFRNQETIAVLNMDVNNLKQINDVYGHETGDKLLLRAAESLKKIEARNIIPFRVGGDEFIVAVLHVDRGEADRIRQAIGGKRIAAILLTHGHFDHIGAVRPLMEKGTRLIIHTMDALRTGKCMRTKRPAREKETSVDFLYIPRFFCIIVPSTHV